VNGLTLVTRNIADFAKCGIPVSSRRPKSIKGRRGERWDRVDRRGDDVDPGEDRERDGDERDEVAPPEVAERRLVARRRNGRLRLVGPDERLAEGRSGRGRAGEEDVARIAHERFSSAFVREKEIAEMVAMMRKIMIEIAAARP
jgi:hypothetical protein